MQERRRSSAIAIAASTAKTSWARVSAGLDAFPLNPQSFDEARAATKGPLGCGLTLLVALLFLAYAAYLAAQNELRPDAVATSFGRLDVDLPITLRMEWNPDVVHAESVVPIPQTISDSRYHSAMLEQNTSAVWADGARVCPAAIGLTAVGVVPSTQNARVARVAHGPGWAMRLREGYAQRLSNAAAARTGAPFEETLDFVQCTVAGALKTYAVGVALSPPAGSYLWSWNGTHWQDEFFPYAISSLVSWRQKLILALSDRGASLPPAIGCVIEFNPLNREWQPLGGRVQVQPSRPVTTQLKRRTPKLLVWEDKLCVAGSLQSVGLPPLQSRSLACWDGTAWVVNIPGFGCDIAAVGHWNGGLAVFLEPSPSAADDATLRVIYGTWASHMMMSVALPMAGREQVSNPYTTSHDVLLTTSWHTVSSDVEVRAGTILPAPNGDGEIVLPNVDVKRTSVVAVNATISCLWGEVQAVRDTMQVAKGLVCLEGYGPSNPWLSGSSLLARLWQVGPTRPAANGHMPYFTFGNQLCTLTLNTSCMAMLCWDAVHGSWATVFPCRPASSGLLVGPKIFAVEWNRTLCVRSGPTFCWQSSSGGGWVRLRIAIAGYPDEFHRLLVYKGQLCTGEQQSGTMFFVCWDGAYTSISSDAQQSRSFEGTTFPMLGQGYSWSGGQSFMYRDEPCLTAFIAPFARPEGEIACYNGSAWVLLPYLGRIERRFRVSNGLLHTDDDGGITALVNGTWLHSLGLDTASPVLLPLGPMAIVAIGQRRANGQVVNEWGGLLVRRNGSQVAAGVDAWPAGGSESFTSATGGGSVEPLPVPSLVNATGLTGADSRPLVLALVAYGDGLLAIGGMFTGFIRTENCSSTSNRCLRKVRGLVTFDPHNATLHALAGGPGSGVYTLTRDAAGTLYAGGAFAGTGVDSAGLSRFAYWDGRRWKQAIPPLDDDAASAGTYVSTIAPLAPGVGLLAGRFKSCGGIILNSMAAWDATARSVAPVGGFTHTFSWQLTEAAINPWVVRVWGEQVGVGTPLVLNVSDVLPFQVDAYYGFWQHAFGYEVWRTYWHPSSYARLWWAGKNSPTGGSTGLGGVDGPFGFCALGTAAFASAGNEGGRCCLTDLEDLDVCAVPVGSAIVLPAGDCVFALKTSEETWARFCEAGANSIVFFLTPDRFYTTNVVESNKASAFTLLGTAMGTLGMLATAGLWSKRLIAKARGSSGRRGGKITEDGSTASKSRLNTVLSPTTALRSDRRQATVHIMHENPLLDEKEPTQPAVAQATWSMRRRPTTGQVVFSPLEVAVSSTKGTVARQH